MHDVSTVGNKWGVNGWVGWMWPRGGAPLRRVPWRGFLPPWARCHCLLGYCCRTHLHASLWGVFKSTVQHAHQCCRSRGGSLECWLPPALLWFFFSKGSKRLKLKCVQVVFKKLFLPHPPSLCHNLTSRLPKKKIFIRYTSVWLKAVNI